MTARIRIRIALTALHRPVRIAGEALNGRVMPKSNQSRQKILDSAKDLIWTCGYRGTSVDDICTAAGVRKGSFYHFFPSKEALTVAALEDEWQQRRPDLERLFFPDTPPMERLQGFFDLTYQQQRLAWERNGQVPSCALFVIGCETSPDFPEIRRERPRCCLHGMRGA